MFTVAKKLAVVCSILAFAGVTLPAYAAGGGPAMTISDGARVITVDQTGTVTYSGTCTVTSCTTDPLNTNGTAGGNNLTWTGTIGDFSLGLTGTTKPNLGGTPGIDLGINSVRSGAIGGTLTLLFTDTDFTTLAPYNLTSNNIFGTGSTQVTYVGYTDAGNAQFGTTVTVGQLGPVGAGTPFGYIDSLPGSSGSGVSLTEKTVLQMGPNASFNDDFGFYGSGAPLTLSCPASSGVVGALFTSGLSALGGQPPFTYSIVGSLPLGLVLNPVTGAITGTPAGLGLSYSFTGQVTDSAGAGAASTVTTPCSISITVPLQPLTLTCPLPNASLGTSYSSALTGGGGTGKYSYSLASGSLPNGLTLISSTGAISGTPSAADSSSFIAQVTDTGNLLSQPVTATCVITVPAPTGSIGNVVWTDTNSNGVQDAGEAGITGIPVTLKDSKGVIVATATTGTGGAYSFTGLGTGTYTVCTSPGVGLTETFDLDGLSTLNCATGALAANQNRTDFDFGYKTFNTQTSLAIACASSSATLGVAYSSKVVATGGTVPYTYTLVGTLPAGLKLGADGTISGTPTSGSPATFSIKVTDKNGITGTSSCGISVSVPLSASCPTGAATVGVSYSSTVKTVGGVGPYIYSVAWGALPTGLLLNTSTGAITGKPTTAQHAAFRIRVTDSKGTVAFTSCSGSCSNGTTVSHEMHDGNGKLPTSQDYGVSGYKLHAYGFDQKGKPANLHGHNESNNSIGIGLEGTLNNEIDATHFVQVDISEIVKAGASSIHFAMNNVSWGESYDVYGSNTLGSKGTLIKGQCTDRQAYFTVPNFKNYKYICFQAHNSHVLLGSFSADFPCTCGIDVAAGGGSCPSSYSHQSDGWDGSNWQQELSSSWGWFSSGYGEDDRGGTCNTGDDNKYTKCQTDGTGSDRSGGAWGDGKQTCYTDSRRDH